MNQCNSIEKAIKRGKKPCNVGSHGKHCVFSRTENRLKKKDTSKAIRRESKKLLKTLEIKYLEWYSSGKRTPC